MPGFFPLSKILMLAASEACLELAGGGLARIGSDPDHAYLQLTLPGAIASPSLSKGFSL